MGHKRDLQSAIGREGGGGHSLQWESSDATSLLLKRFRNAVINQNADAVKSTIVTLGVSESEAENIALLLINRSSAEPTKEALLTAITTACRPLVEYILPLFYEFPGEERNGCCNSEVFPSHVTPLMLACICNNFAIVECLLMRNHSVMLPHRPDCDCDECFRNGNSPEIEIIRLDTYRAISSDAFLWLACEDPLLAACWLAKDLEICSKLENNSREVYRGLRESVMKFGLKLVQYCWSMEEVDLLLSRKHGVALSECSLRLPRARLALDSQMKYVCEIKTNLPLRNPFFKVLLWKSQGSSIFNIDIQHFQCRRNKRHRSERIRAQESILYVRTCKKKKKKGSKIITTLIELESVNL